jgi:hypothetical protein
MVGRRRKGRVPLPEEKKRSIRIVTTLRPDEADELQEAAIEAGETVSDVVRSAVIRSLEEVRARRKGRASDSKSDARRSKPAA